MTIAPGDKAPAFTLPSDGEGTISLSDFKGKNLILYFYPKDNTPGCSKESCDFRDSHPDFSAANAVIVGASKDSVKSHDNFKSKYDLPFPLISDVDLELCKSYNVWVEKNMYGRKYMGIERATFLIDGKGVIRNVWRKVKVKGHAAEVLEAVGNL